VPWLDVGLPSRWVNERAGGLAQPLSYPQDQIHIGQPGSPQVGQAVRRASQLSGEGRPSQPVLLTVCVHRRMQLAEIPAKPSVRTGLGQSRVSDVDDVSGQKVLRRTVDPAQHEQRVLTGDVAALLEPRNRAWAKRAVRTLCVELGGLLPERRRQLVPVESLAASLAIERAEERVTVEARQSHALSISRSAATGKPTRMRKRRRFIARPDSGGAVSSVVVGWAVPFREHSLRWMITVWRVLSRRSARAAFARG